MTSRLPNCSLIDAAATTRSLSLLTPDDISRWHGLPLSYIGTPEGVWNHRFTPSSTVVSLLDTGNISASIHLMARPVEFDAVAGALTLFNADQGVRALQRGSCNARRILVDLNMSSLAHNGLLDDALASTPLRPVVGFTDPPLTAVLREMLREIQRGCPNGTLFAESLSVGVGLHLWRTRSARVVPASRERGKLSNWQCARIDELIVDELANDLSLSALSDALGLSKPNFMRLFRNTLGTTPHRYVMQKRVERARYLITATDLPLIEIAATAGFANQSHLSNVFLQKFGVTPGHARKHSGRRNPDETGVRLT